jgi:hypothetical protein
LANVISNSRVNRLEEVLMWCLRHHLNLTSG